MTTTTVDKPVVKEVTTPIKPSEAYKLGRMIAPGWTNYQYYDPEANTACAYGAMALGLGLLTMGEEDTSAGLVDAVKARTLGTKYSYKCRCDFATLLDHRSVDILDVIEHYSDDHRKTLGSDKRIVALLESVGL